MFNKKQNKISTVRKFNPPSGFFTIKLSNIITPDLLLKFGNENLCCSIIASEINTEFVKYTLAGFVFYYFRQIL